MKESSRDQDRLLVGECLKGSQKAWNEFYCQYIGLIRAVIRRFKFFAPEDQEDLAQDIFSKIVLSLDQYDSQYSMASYISVISKNACIGEIRKRSKERKLGAKTHVDHHDGYEDAGIQISDDALIPEEELERRELILILIDGLSELDSLCKKILELKHFNGLKYKDMAPILGKKANAMAVAAHRCMDQLKENCRKLMQRRRTE